MKMHAIQFVSMMMVIQMKLKKVISMMKNMMNKELQLEMESQLIQVSMMKMQKIRFVSMKTVIQTKWKRVGTLERKHRPQVAHTNLEARSARAYASRNYR
jgi:hypothetical protein